MKDNSLKRSVLYVPGDNKKALHKVLSLAVDVVLFDLEDAVTPDKKTGALENTIDALKADYGYRKKIVRINDLSSSWSEQELKGLANSNIDGICLPKVNEADDILELGQLMQKLNYPTSVKIWAMIETPLGVLNSYKITQASERLTTLVMGINDLSKEMRVPQTKNREGFIYCLSQTVLSARASGKDIIDGVCMDFKSDKALLGACEQGKVLGFDGKTLIHPSQIALTNQVFSPSLQEIEQAGNIITAWQESIAAGASVAVLNDRLIEQLHYEEAVRIQQLHQAIQTITAG